MSEAQKTLEAIIEEAMQPIIEQMNKAMEALESGQKLMSAQDKIIRTTTDALVDIAGWTAQAIKDSDDPEVRLTLNHIAQRLNDVVDSVREQL